MPHGWGRPLLATLTCVICLGWHPPTALASIPLTRSTLPSTSNSSAVYFSLPPQANLGTASSPPSMLVEEPPASDNDTNSRAVGVQPLSARGAARALADSTATRAEKALRLLAAARSAVDQGRYEQALLTFSQVATEDADLALAAYARMGRALMLYQTGNTREALLALEDEEVSLRGAAEVHAALAALLWVEKPGLAFRAEQQWAVAREFDTRYSDVAWVAANKHWPPRALDALTRFLRLER
ncbi:hypothetical protein QJQ45_024659 [Haematococcus lacustris]|nr:hypothetical protein QJQ45_024659 [Haematococcus lacustris]